jgi:hypothetical protein
MRPANVAVNNNAQDNAPAVDVVMALITILIVNDAKLPHPDERRGTYAQA